MASTSKTYGNFDLVKEIQLEDAGVSLAKWRSRETGLSVVHVDRESPLVEGYFTVRTEIFDDSGCPHTLEHLIFLGSEKYPFKGVLDNLANRAFSNGTNAWTDTDNTTYTVTTAGQDGFLQLLPIYLDHILYPTITDSGFVTEVHHVNGDAEDAGVVYAEMQGREQSSGDLMQLKLQRTLYPAGSAYRSETGGLMEALRVLTAEKIREYHHSYYVPHNICLVVVGRLSTETLLDVLQNKVEPDLIKHQQNGPPSGWKRPFIDTESAKVPKVSTLVTETVQFPEKDESVGDMVAAYIGPSIREPLERQAIDILFQYLTDSPVSPFMKEFVEIPSPLCTYIWYNEDLKSAYSSMEVYFGSVPVEEQDNMHSKVLALSKKIVEEGVDMERMTMIIKRAQLKHLSTLESSAGEYYSSGLVTDFLYGSEDGSDLAPMMSENEQYKALLEWSPAQWSSLLKKYLVDLPPVIVQSKPNSSLPEKLEAEEKARITAQKKALGEDGLKRLARELEEAKKENDRPIPPEMLTSFPVPSISSISWIPVQTARNEPSKALPTKDDNELEKHVAKDGTDLPFFLQFDHVKSNFITVSAYLSTSAIPPELLPCLNVYCSAFFSLPVTRADGTKLSQEDVVKQLNNITVEYTADGAPLQNLIRIRLKTELSQYSGAVTWLKDLLTGAVFTKERLEVVTAQVQQSLPEQKRDGETVLYAVHPSVVFDETSTSKAAGVTTQMEYIPQLAQRLKEDPKSVINDFEKIREALLKPDGIRFSVYGNVLGVPAPRTPWRVFDGLKWTDVKPIPIPVASLSELGKNPAKKAVVVTLPSIESSFALHTTKSFAGFDHKDHAALKVACEVLEATESYFYKYIRGSGLAYGTFMEVDAEAGLLSFSVYRAPDSYRAFEEARKVVESLVDGSIVLDQTVVDGAKSSLVYKATRAVSTPPRAAATSFINQALKGVPQNHGRELLEKMQNVTVEEVKETLKKYVLPIFDPATSIAVVVSSPAKADEISENFSKVGYEVERRTLDIGADEEIDDEESGSEGSSTT